MNIAIIGGTGFIGRYLTIYFEDKGNNVFIISRSLMQKENELIKIIEKSDVLLNFAGEPIDGIWTKKKKVKIIESRVQSAEKVFKVLKRVKKVPDIYIQASAVGIYKEGTNDLINEKYKKFSNSFLGYVTKEWEKIANRNTEMKSRIIILRLGIVLGINGGFFKKMFPFIKAKVGLFFNKNKERIFSFIYIKEIGPIIEHIIDNKQILGAINIVNNIRITYEEFFKCIIRKFELRIRLWIPDIFLKLILGEASALLFSSYRIVPEILNNSGYTFKFQNLEDIINDITKDLK
jgi:uncharacterized protein (TIGR01777 family)